MKAHYKEKKNIYLQSICNSLFHLFFFKSARFLLCLSKTNYSFQSSNFFRCVEKQKRKIPQKYLNLKKTYLQPFFNVVILSLTSLPAAFNRKLVLFLRFLVVIKIKAQSANVYNFPHTYGIYRTMPISIILKKPQTLTTSNR